MTAFSLIDMQEATRLTREGRLSEATALLQGRVPKPVPNAARRPASDDADILDLEPPGAVGGAWTTARPEGPHLQPTFVRRSGKAGEATTPLVAGARFEDHSYSGAAGRRAYKLYVPSGFDGQSLPLVVMLHGCTQSPDDFAAGTRMNILAEQHRFLVAYPTQPQSANASKCWNWFNAADQHRGQGEPSLIAGITCQVMDDFAVDPDRVYVAGLSAGGAAAAIMGSAYPDLYAAIGVHSGLACGAASDMPSAFSAMQRGGRSNANRGARPVPTIVFHGDRDTTVSALNGDQVIAQSKGDARLRTTISTGQAEGGVTYTQTVYRGEGETPVLEHWVLHGAGHAWSGGSRAGSYTDPRGPDASAEMIRFFHQHRLAPRR